MNELKSIDNEYQKLKEELKDKKDDLKMCYKNEQDISNLIQRLKNISVDSIRQKKEELIEIYKKERKHKIYDIINLSYMSFMNKDESEEIDYKSLILDIQNSSFYDEYKDNFKIKEMEIEYIMIEAEETNDYLKALEKLKEMEKIVFDYSLKKEIKNYIDECQKAIANNKKLEIKKLLEKQDFNEAIKKFENLLQDKNLFKYTYREYLKTLEYLIQIKINEGNKNINEIQIYKEFIQKNKDNIICPQIYLKKISRYELNNIYEKEEQINNIELIFKDKNQMKIERKDVDYYLDEIEKNIPENELEEFYHLRDFIYEQIINFDNEIKNNYINSKKWISNRKACIHELNDIKNIGKIYSYLNYINKQSTKYNIYTIQLISLLVLSQKLPKKTKGVFCKINTGEGKSTIVQLFAAYKVLSGHKVDIVSSSPVLAKRDATDKKKKAFFEQLGITVGFLEEKSNPYDLDIIYGDTTSFSADILYEIYEFDKKRKGRGFDIVIIDEVDNMCIDNLASKTQLTKKFSGYQSLYTFYYTIVLSFNCIACEMKLLNNPAEIEKK